MAVILPAMNTIWFWFKPESERRRLHGTPADVMRKFDVLQKSNCCSDGLEIFLTPSKLSSPEPFMPDFYKAFVKLAYRSVHIGELDPDFLDNDSAYNDLIQLQKTMSRLESNTLILHAHHLKTNRSYRRNLLRSALGSVEILIENNGFDNPWGGDVNSLEEIFTDCSDFGLCLDIAHVKDCSGSSLDDYIANDTLIRRLKEIHFSYSTFQLKSDPYEDKGYNGYHPYHALFSIVNVKPSKRTIEFASEYPVVIEGIVPVEDQRLESIKREAALLEKRG